MPGPSYHPGAGYVQGLGTHAQTWDKQGVRMFRADMGLQGVVTHALFYWHLVATTTFLLEWFLLVNAKTENTKSGGVFGMVFLKPSETVFIRSKTITEQSQFQIVAEKMQSIPNETQWPKKHSLSWSTHVNGSETEWNEQHRVCAFNLAHSTHLAVWHKHLV